MSSSRRRFTLELMQEATLLATKLGLRLSEAALFADLDRGL